MSGRIKAPLPAQTTNFVGRCADMEALTALVRSSRLVTITGAAGIGKTRLAIEVTRCHLGAGAGVRFVELAGLTDEALLGQEVASRLGVPEQAGEPLAQTMTAHIGEQALLLVIDNCEHLVAACAGLVDTLLRGCPNLRVLATSLLPLRVPGEVVWRLGPLSLPGSGLDGSRRPVAESEAERLFQDRARLVQPGFAIEPDNADAVARVCRRLDGIPLAIELAAALMESMSAQEVLTRLEDHFRVLAGGGRDTVARHRTLHAAVDWGHQLLDDQERRVFRRLSVFAGGFELTACEAVCADGGVEPEEVGGVVLRLVERSLVRPETQRRGPARYRLLEPIRQYAAQRLADRGERPAVAERHAAHFLGLAALARDEERGEDQPGWLERLETELDNLRVALAWCLACNVDACLDMASALSWFWVTRGHYTEGLAWLDGALARAPAKAPGRASALLGAARLCFWQGDYAAARRFCLAGLDGFERRGDAVGRGWALTLLGSICAYEGEYDESKGWLVEVLDSVPHDLVRMEALVGMGEMLLHAGDLRSARAQLEEVLRQARGPEAPRGRAALFLGIIAVMNGDAATARAQLAWSLEIFQRLGNLYAGAAALDALAALAMARTDPLRALRLSGAAAALRASTRSQLAPRWRQLLQAVVLGPARAVAGDRATAAWAEGERMTFAEAVRYARTELPVAAESPGPSPNRRAPVSKSPAGLTRRELEVAHLVAERMTNRQIADRLVIAERTVEGHVERVRCKLGVHSRTEIAGSIMRQQAWPSDGR